MREHLNEDSRALLAKYSESHARQFHTLFI